jgi:hypothetical protein
MRTKLLIVIAVAVLMLVLVAPAAAVQYGQPDGNGHPYVGLVSFHNAAGVPLWRCTGTLVSSTVFLTAAHCTEAPAAKAVIWFSPIPSPLATGADQGRLAWARPAILAPAMRVVRPFRIPAGLAV